MPDTPTRDTVYFYKFNNYYNRIIKRYDTIEEYPTPLGTQSDCNFVHGDGINSTFTFNKPSNINDTPDYVIVEDYKGNLSRWFVTNSFKTRDRQDKLDLRRDLIADYYSDIVKYSPCLIRKGYVKGSSPFIYNDEGVKYNKIKKEEILIKDMSDCSYIIGFIANNAPAVAEIKGTIKATNYDYVYSSLADFPLKNYVEGAGNNHTETAKIINGSIYYAVKFSAQSVFIDAVTPSTFEMTFSKNGYGKPSWYTNSYSTEVRIDDNLYLKSYSSESSLTITFDETDLLVHYTEVGEAYRETCKNVGMFANESIETASKSLLGVEEDDYEDLQQFIGKRIKIGAIIYDCKLSPASNTTNNSVTANNTIRSRMNSAKPTNLQVSTMLPSRYDAKYKTGNVDWVNADIKVLAKTSEYYLIFTEAANDIKTELKAANNRTHLTSQPYDMFVLINEGGVSYKVGTDSFVSNHEVNINIAQAICQASGTSAYDVQIVPFNPIQGAILDDGTINWYNYDVVPVKDGSDNVIGHYILCNDADFKISLDKDGLDFYIPPEERKKDFNLKEYRLCSPNQETVFEFSPSMNDFIRFWEITCNYRPYASYIKIQPRWRSLYGIRSYNGLTDFRGLVYNSSLCVTQLSDAWANYVSSNKNYQQLFDNQISTLTKQQNIEINAMEDTLGLRSFTGMPISSILRTIGGSKDIDMQRELNNVALAKMQTDFKYQMDNIKSMPYTIKKLTNINGDTRIFPFIEIYSCSSEEEESFDLKMKYTGYTIMTTGYINNFIKSNTEAGEFGTFIQADLIRLDLSRSEESADNHMAVEIANELSKGVFLKKEE